MKTRNLLKLFYAIVIGITIAGFLLAIYCLTLAGIDLWWSILYSSNMWIWATLVCYLGAMDFERDVQNCGCHKLVNKRRLEKE